MNRVVLAATAALLAFPASAQVAAPSTPAINGVATQAIDIQAEGVALRQALGQANDQITALKARIAELEAQTPPPPPPVDPPPPPPAIADARQITATTQGYKDGMCPSLTTGAVTSTAAGQIIECRSAASVTINHPNVTLRKSKVTGTGYMLVKVAQNVTGTVIEDVTIQPSSRQEGQSCVQFTGTMRRTTIIGCDNAVDLAGPGPTLIEGNYMRLTAGPGSPHYDTIQNDGATQGVTIRGNWLENPFGQTSAIMNDNYWGTGGNVTIEGNALIGGGYTVYADGSFKPNVRLPSVVFKDNWLKRGYYGYALARNADVTWTGNKDIATGAAIDAP